MGGKGVNLKQLEPVQPEKEHTLSYSGPNVYVHQIDEKIKPSKANYSVYSRLDRLIPDQDGLKREFGGSSAVRNGWQEDLMSIVDHVDNYLLKVYANDDVPGIVVASSPRLSSQQMRTAAQK